MQSTRFFQEGPCTAPQALRLVIVIAYSIFPPLLLSFEHSVINTIPYPLRVHINMKVSCAFRYFSEVRMQIAITSLFLKLVCYPRLCLRQSREIVHFDLSPIDSNRWRISWRTKLFCLCDKCISWERLPRLFEHTIEKHKFALSCRIGLSDFVQKLLKF